MLNHYAILTAKERLAFLQTLNDIDKNAELYAQNTENGKMNGNEKENTVVNSTSIKSALKNIKFTDDGNWLPLCNRIDPLRYCLSSRDKNVAVYDGSSNQAYTRNKELLLYLRNTISHIK